MTSDIIDPIAVGSLSISHIYSSVCASMELRGNPCAKLPCSSDRGMQAQGYDLRKNYYHNRLQVGHFMLITGYRLIPFRNSRISLTGVLSGPLFSFLSPASGCSSTLK